MGQMTLKVAVMIKLYEKQSLMFYPQAETILDHAW